MSKKKLKKSLKELEYIKNNFDFLVNRGGIQSNNGFNSYNDSYDDIQKRMSKTVVDDTYDTSKPIKINTIFRSILSFEKYIKSIAKENPEDMDLFDSINIEIWDKARKERKKPKDFVFTTEFWLFIKEHADIHFWINLKPFELSLMYFSHLLTNK